jgi:beta-lactam-binding protein with PASTA domain
MKRFFNILFGALAMIAIMVVSAFVAMRLAIHGREVEVPVLAGLTSADASARARALGLNLRLENRFYSNAVPAGHILTQSPAAGSIVRRDGQIRVAESLGGQHVTIPDLMGQSERAATVVLRRLNLELGSVAHMPAAGPEGVVIAQTPPPKSVGADTPRVSLILSSPLETPAAPDANPQPEAPLQTEPEAYVMPTLVFLTIGTASARLATAGLHIATATDASAPAATATTEPPATPAVPLSSSSAVAFPVAPRTAPSSYVITSQTPLAGHRIVKGDAIRVSAIPRTVPAN